MFSASARTFKDTLVKAASRLIATVRGRGHRFMGSVEAGAPALDDARASPLDLIGREAELARADAALDRFERGERRISW